MQPVCRWCTNGILRVLTRFNPSSFSKWCLLRNALVPNIAKNELWQRFGPPFFLWFSVTSQKNVLCMMWYAIRSKRHLLNVDGFKRVMISFKSSSASNMNTTFSQYFYVLARSTQLCYEMGKLGLIRNIPRILQLKFAIAFSWNDCRICSYRFIS